MSAIYLEPGEIPGSLIPCENRSLTTQSSPMTPRMSSASTLYNQYAPLMIHEHNDELKAALCLLDNKCWFAVTDDTNNTLLHVAAQSWNVEITKYLIELGSQIDAQNDRGETPLMLAIVNDCDKIVEVLVEAGADYFIFNNFGTCALQMIRNPEVLNIFMKRITSDCSKNVEDMAKKLFNCEFPLYQIVQVKNVELTRILLERGYAADSQPYALNSRQTALKIAIQTSDVDNVKLLLNHIENVNELDLQRRTILSHVYDYELDNPHTKEKFEIFKMLLDRGAILNTVNTHQFDGYILLEKGSADIIKLLLESNASLNVADFLGSLAVHYIAMNEDLDVLKQLGNPRFNLNIRNSRGHTALIWASGKDKINAVKYLLQSGADVDAVDVNRRTALYHAVFKENKACVQLLLEYGASVEIKLQNLRASKVLDVYKWKKIFPSRNLVLAHLALQQARGIPVDQLILKDINLFQSLSDYFERSKQELKRKIYESFSLYDFLTENQRKFECHLRNEDLVCNLVNYLSKPNEFHYFNTILKKRQKECQENLVLQREAATIICRIMGMNYERFPLIADQVVSYLDKEDMEKLVNVLT